ncbi:hypothetical protein CDD83_5072 [Cordyceps sp. RAO-2017]|nr:hypothetical protein CDD83_5072 [Cordyceps sp. RAO-2017]
MPFPTTMFGYTFAILLLGHACKAASAQTRATSLAEKLIIPHWDLQSSAKVDRDLARVSQPGYDSSSWYHIQQSRCTLMGCLLAAGVYNDSNLWFSDNLRHFDTSLFSVPWVYRNEFSLAPTDGQHYLLETNGVTSKADIYLNGDQIANKDTQVGSFGGHTYDVTGLVSRRNALVISAHPGDFSYDLIQGFVDWNPSPPDNATGIWRDIYLRQTGPVSMGPASVSIEMNTDVPLEDTSARVTVRAKAQNLVDHKVQLVVRSIVTDPTGRDNICEPVVVELSPGEFQLIEMDHQIDNPEIWWPKQWGGQPLYKSELIFWVNSRVSDSSRQSFGIRTVTSGVNSHNDTLFTINGRPFQVIGGGYAPDHFFRWDRQRFLAIARYTLDMGLNTIRLEGTLEHPELYEIADELGIMIMAGWVCCSKWEAWKYNTDLQLDPFPLWVDRDYETANASMIHEAAMLQSHPSILAFLVGSDSWPNDRATKIYVDALKGAHWQTPVIASAAKRGYPELLGPSGLKMDGPYDWVPPSYWYDTEPTKERLGAAFGFGSELGAGVGTPEYGSLKKFLAQKDLEDLWMRPEMDLFHMSANKSAFKNRRIYNEALFQKYGPPTSLKDYLLKSQIMDYEATRAQHEGYASRWNAERPATGTIYWMLNNAWPALHWNLFDYAMHPAGSYFGAKTAGRIQHVAYDYVDHSIWLINRSLHRSEACQVAVELIDLGGKVLSTQTLQALSKANTATKVGIVEGVGEVDQVAFLRLILNGEEATLSRNVYWITKAVDTLEWKNSTWRHTPVSKFADFTSLSKMETARIRLTSPYPNTKRTCNVGKIDQEWRSLELENESSVPAFFIRLNLIDEMGDDVNPVIWSDNYITMWPREKITLEVNYAGGRVQDLAVEVSGGNIESSIVHFNGPTKNNFDREPHIASAVPSRSTGDSRCPKDAIKEKGEKKDRSRLLNPM